MIQLHDRINIWCDTLENKAKNQTYGNQNIYFHYSVGKRYIKIMMTYQDTKQDTVHAFVDKQNGDVYKAASWSSPYKDKRYSLITEFNQILSDCDWVGTYLYKK